MKKLSYKITTFLVGVLLFGACSEDFLDLPPKNNGTVAEFYQSEADFETAIVAVYKGFSNAVLGLMMMEEYRADNLWLEQYVYYELSSNQFGLNSTSSWWNLYSSIVFPANVILDKIDDVEMDAEVKNRIKGEAYFLRGYAYFTMNMWFGGVPKVTTQMSVDESYTLGRSTESEIWGLVASDFEQAHSLLDPSVEIGRVDKYDAGAFLAKTYAMQNKWGDVKTVIKEVWENSGAMLEEEWTSLWTMDAEKNSKEYMLSVISSPEASNNNWAQQFLYEEDTPGLQGNFRYKPGYLESFEDGDIRKDLTLGYTKNQLREQNRKYIFGYDLNDYRWVGDIVVLRYADVQLLYAEAISMEAGSPQQQSLDLMNETRGRAKLVPLSMSNISSLDDMIEAILAERRAEFAFEGHRYTDLKRHNKLVEKVNAAVEDFNLIFNETYNYVPIPQQEIDKVGSDILIQNLGY